MKKILVSALAILLVLMSVIGCAKEGGTDATTTTVDAQTTTHPAEDVKTTLDIVVDGKSDVTIVFPEGNNEISLLGSKLRNEIYSLSYK